MKNTVLGYCVAQVQSHTNGVLPETLQSKVCYRFSGLAETVVSQALITLLEWEVIEYCAGSICLDRRLKVAAFTPAVAVGYVIGMVEQEARQGTALAGVAIVREQAQLLCNSLMISSTVSVADRIYESVYLLYHANILQGYATGSDPEAWRVALRGQLSTVEGQLAVVA